MKTSSCKAKGRKLQQKIRDMYRELGKGLQLEDGDIESRGMGQQGTDIIFSPKALYVFDHDIECKKHKAVSVPKLFEEHYKKYKDNNHLKLLFHENDRSEALVTMRASDFLALLAKLYIEQ
jgi:hypothetical protein